MHFVVIYVNHQRSKKWDVQSCDIGVFPRENKVNPALDKRVKIR
jgi:hypothetical protein